MNARLMKNNEGLWLLYSNGMMTRANEKELSNLLFHFQAINKFRTEQANAVDLQYWNTECPEMSLYPGDTVAYVSDSFQLVILNFEPFKGLFYNNSSLDDLMTVPEYARLYNKSIEQVKVFCRNGRIPGAKKIGRDWVIPGGAPYPFDNRITKGNYLKNKENT